MGVSSYDPVASNNTDVSGVGGTGIAEGNFPSTINNAIRQVLADIALGLTDGALNVQITEGFFTAAFDGATVAFSVEDGAAQAITMPNEFHVMLSLGGVMQHPGQAFTVSGSTLTFSEAPVATDEYWLAVLRGNITEV